MCALWTRGRTLLFFVRFETSFCTCLPQNLVCFYKFLPSVFLSFACTFRVTKNYGVQLLAKHSNTHIFWVNFIASLPHSLNKLLALQEWVHFAKECIFRFKDLHSNLCTCNELIIQDTKCHLTRHVYLAKKFAFQLREPICIQINSSHKFVEPKCYFYFVFFYYLNQPSHLSGITFFPELIRNNCCRLINGVS